MNPRAPHPPRWNTLWALTSALGLCSGAEGGELRLDSLRKIHALSQTLQLQQLHLSLNQEGRSAKLRQITEGSGLETRRFQIYQDGIEVVGHQALTHLDEHELRLTPAQPKISISVQPQISSQVAADLAREHTRIQGDRRLVDTPKLKILPDATQQGAKLIYWVTIDSDLQDGFVTEGRDILIDATNGALIGDIGHHLEIDTPASNHAKITSTECQQLSPDTGAPTGLNVANCPTAVKDGKVSESATRSAFRAFLNAANVLKYFADVHHRNSYDGKGSELISLVHVGQNFANAFWSTDGGFMAYGDGDGLVMGDLTRSLDVAGHEMTHGVTATSAGLIYMDESGALNEAFSDFFGVVIAARSRKTEADWAIGKSIFNNERKLVGLRNLKNPGSIQARFLTQEGAFELRPYPSRVGEKFESYQPCNQRNDRCYVHVNSMIPGHAMFRVSEAIGLERTEKLMYLTLTHYLTPASGFKDFRDQTLQACTRLLSGDECSKVTQIFDELGF